MDKFIQGETVIKLSLSFTYKIFDDDREILKVATLDLDPNQYDIYVKETANKKYLKLTSSDNLSISQLFILLDTKRPILKLDAYLIFDNTNEQLIYTNAVNAASGLINIKIDKMIEPHELIIEC